MDPLFNDENNPSTQTPPVTPQTPPTDVFADQLAAVKNENGEQKYDTVEKAIEALNHSQQYIPQLKGDLAAREEEVIKLQAKLEAMGSVQDIVNQQTPPNQEPATTQPIGEEQILEMVTKALSSQSQADTENSNQSQVSQTLATKYGDNAQAEIAAKAKSLGMKPSELGKLSKTNPTMVLALFGEKVGNTSITTNSVHIPASPQEPEALVRPEKSLLSGATSQEQAAFMKKIKEEVWRKHGITE